MKNMKGGLEMRDGRIYKRVKDLEEIYKLLDKKFGRYYQTFEGTVSWTRCQKCNDYTKRTYTLTIKKEDGNLEYAHVIEPCPFCGEEGEIEV
jgi:hypothetical protein